MNKKTVLLTGATGFLGSHILESLIGSNLNIIIIKRSFSDISRIKDNLSKIKFYDIDKINLEKVFIENKIDFIVHCATLYGRKNENNSSILEANLVLPFKLLELGIKFNADTFFNADTSLPTGLNFYVNTKKDFIKYSKKLIERSNINFLNIKLEHIYGPNDDKTKFIPFILDKLKEREINLTKGKQLRDFIYIDDVTNAYLFILRNIEKIKFEKNFFDCELGTSKNISIRELVEKLKKKMKSKSKLNFGALDYRKNEIMISNAKIEFLKSLGWKPKINIDEGLDKIIKQNLIN